MNGQVVLVAIQGGRYLQLNKLGSVIWHFLEQESTLPDLVERVVSLYRVGRAQCESDVASFLASLGSAGLVVDRGVPPSQPENG